MLNPLTERLKRCAEFERNFATLVLRISGRRVENERQRPSHRGKRKTEKDSMRDGVDEHDSL
jgi:hypothetical protein